MFYCVGFIISLCSVLRWVQSTVAQQLQRKGEGRKQRTNIYRSKVGAEAQQLKLSKNNNNDIYTFATHKN